MRALRARIHGKVLKMDGSVGPKVSQVWRAFGPRVVVSPPLAAMSFIVSVTFLPPPACQMARELDS